MLKHIRHILFIFILITLVGCSTDRTIEKEDFSIEKETSKITPERQQEPAQPIETQKETPPSLLDNKAITLTARKADFVDIMNAIADQAGLDLMIDSRLVNEDEKNEEETTTDEDTNIKPIPIPSVTISYNRTPLKDALDNLCYSRNIFYFLRGNSLYISGTESKTYHLNFLSSQKETKISVGGDVLSSSGQESSQKTLSGEFSIKDTTLATSSDVYAQIEESVKKSLTTHGSYSLNRAMGLLEVTDRRYTIERIDEYIKNLKSYYNSQVMITAKVIEVSLNDSSMYGIDWSSLRRTIGDYRISPIEQKLALPTTSLVPAFQIEAHSQEKGIDAALNALQEFGDIKVLSNPRIRVTNGQPALISVGTNSSYIQEIKLTSTTIDNGGTITEPEVTIGSIFDGIMLGVIPYIDIESNAVNLNVTPIKSKIVKLEERNVGGNTYTLPTVDLEEATTQIRMKSGNVIALGGLISKNIKNERKSVPILGDIPYVGYLFSQYTKIVETNELVIIIEPVIIAQ